MTPSSNLYSLGKNSKTTILAIEDGKLSLEFEVTTGQTVYEGMPVKLTADGKITPWVKTDAITKLIGHVYGGPVVGNTPASWVAGDLVTVFMRAHLLIYALSAAAVDCDTPVTQSSYDTSTAVDGGELNGTTGFNKVEQAASNTPMGWALDQADAADELIKVAMFH